MRLLIPPLAAVCLLGACGRASEAPPSTPPASGPQAAAGRLGYRQVREIALRRAPGRIVRVELEEDDPTVYEIRVLTPSGRLVELKIDARTGAVLEQEAE